MKLNLPLSALLLLLFTATASSQSPNWLWAKGMGGSNYDAGNVVAIDALDNVYTAGSFLGTVDFDPGIGIFNMTSNGNNSTFISKLDASGNFIWAKSIFLTGGIGLSYNSGLSIALDASSNIYITGSFSGTVDFDPDSGTFNLTATGGNDIFISKLDASGNFRWAKSMGGTNFAGGRSISLDAFGNVYITGGFSGTVDFDPGSGIFNLTSITGDFFISKMDSSGNFKWAKASRAISSGGGASGNASTLDVAGNIYSTGSFAGTTDFDPGAGTFNLNSAGNNDDIFISKLDSSGNFLWAKRIGGTYFDYGYSIAVDAASNVYTTGSFSSTADFDPGMGVFNLTGIFQFSPNFYISKLDSSGNFVWAKSMFAQSSGKSIVLDASANVFSTGFFDGTADFDLGAGTFNLTSNAIDIFISKFDSSGNFIWAKASGGAMSDQSNSIALNSIGNLYLTGYFYSPSIIFDSTTLTNDTSGNTSDIFIAKLDTAMITGINNVSTSLNMTSVYPNPATNHLTLALGSFNKNVEVTITDITGIIIYTTTVKDPDSYREHKIEVDTKYFASGLYFVLLTNEKEQVKMKVIVQH